MTVEEFIGRLISYRRNDLLIVADLTNEKGIEWDYERIDKAFERLQTAFTRWILNDSICSNKNCICSPRSEIRYLIKVNDKIYKRELYPDDYEWLKEWGE